MPAGRLNILEATRLIHSNDGVIEGLIDEVLERAPEVEALPVRTIAGLHYYALVRKELPSVGFTKLNRGFDPTKSRTELKKFDCLPLGGLVECDDRVANQYPGGLAAYFAHEAAGILEASLIHLSKQVLYGVSNDADGFPGLRAQLAAGQPQVINATGTTASTASSIYFLKAGGVSGVELVFGNETTFRLPDPTPTFIADEEGKKFAGHASQMDGWAGLSVGSVYAIGRIANVTEDSGKGCSDNLIADALSKFPVGWQPNQIWMSRRSAEQLRRSRSTVQVASGGRSSTGVEFSAPVPTEAHGIQIVISDNIHNNEAIESFA